MIRYTLRHQFEYFVAVTEQRSLAPAFLPGLVAQFTRLRPIKEHIEAGRIALARLSSLRPTRLMMAFEAFARGFFRERQEEERIHG